MFGSGQILRPLMSISLNLGDLDPLHYVTADRVASLRAMVEADTNRGLATEQIADVRVLLMALEELTAPAKTSARRSGF